MNEENASDTGATAGTIQQEVATDAEVTEAVEQLVRSVEGEGVAKKPAAKKPARARTSKAAAKPGVDVDALVTTVNSLSATVASLAGSVETLSAKVYAVGPDGLVVKEADDRTAGETSLVEVARSYAVTLAGFVGMGLVAAAAVDTSFDAKALVLALVGCALFTASSMAVDGSGPGTGMVGLVRRLGGNVLTAAGLGMVVGGIQRFADVPEHAAQIIPAGVAAFAAGFLLRGAFKVATEHLVWIAGICVWVCLFLAIGLGHVAGTMAVEAPSEPAVATVEESHATATDHGTEDESTETPVDGSHAEVKADDAVVVEGHPTEAAASDTHIADSAH